MLLDLLLLLYQLHLLSECGDVVLRQLGGVLAVRIAFSHKVHVRIIKVLHLRDLVTLFCSNYNWTASVLLSLDA